MKSIKEADLRNKKILMRAGFDVVIDEAGNIIDDTRIKEALPTIKYILKQKPTSLTIISHLGRPEGKVVEALKMSKVAEKLGDLMRNNRDLKALFEENPDVEELFKVHHEIKEEQLEIGIPRYKISKRISLLENIRFYPEEEKNDPEFAKKLASLGDLFIFEAFSAAHREQASVTGIMDYLPSYAGLGMAKETEELSKLLGDVKHPYILIIGGAKTEDKAPVIDNLKDKVDKILVGGKTSNLLHQEGKYKNDEKVLLNVDGIDENKQVIHPDKDPMAALDIGPETIKIFREEIVKAKTILLAGPLGKIEDSAYIEGSREIFIAAAYSNAYKIACGGDTMETLNKFGLLNNFDFVSTGGGAALEFLAKSTLPAIDKLNQNGKKRNSGDGI